MKYQFQAVMQENGSFTLYLTRWEDAELVMHKDTLCTDISRADATKLVKRGNRVLCLAELANQEERTE